MMQTRARLIVGLFVAAALLAVVGAAMDVTTPGEGANIGAGMVILLAMLFALPATVLTVLDQQAASRAPGLGRRALTVIAAGALVTAVLAVAVGQWGLLVAGVVPAVACGVYAVRARTA